MDKKEILARFFSDIGLEGMSAEESEKLFSQIFENLQDRVIVRLSSLLNAEEKTLWESLKTDEELENFYKEKGLNLDEITEEEAKIAREELIQNIAYIKGKMK